MCRRLGNERITRKHQPVGIWHVIGAYAMDRLCFPPIKIMLERRCLLDWNSGDRWALRGEPACWDDAHEGRDVREELSLCPVRTTARKVISARRGSGHPNPASSSQASQPPELRGMFGGEAAHSVLLSQWSKVSRQGTFPYPTVGGHLQGIRPSPSCRPSILVYL